MANTTPRWFKKAQAKAKKELDKACPNAVAQGQVVTDDVVIETYVGRSQSNNRLLEVRYYKIGDQVMFGIYEMYPIAGGNANETENVLEDETAAGF